MTKTTKILLGGIIVIILMISWYVEPQKNISSSATTDIVNTEPTARLMINNKSFLQVTPESEIRFTWETSDINKTTLSFETIIASPKATCGITNRVFENGEKILFFTPSKIQSPCTWKVILTAENTTTGKIAKSAVYLQVMPTLKINPNFTAAPTATLVVNGIKDALVKADTRNLFHFASTNTNVWLGTYEVVEGDNTQCKLGSIMFRNGNGGADGTYGSRFVGCKWRFTYVAANTQTGQIAESSVTLKIQ